VPLYSYKCSNDVCQHEDEIIHRYSDTSPRACPKCGSEFQKLISGVNFKLKGDGWYKSGYSGKSK